MQVVCPLACKINFIHLKSNARHPSCNLELPRLDDSPQPLQTLQHVSLDALVLLVALQQGDGVVVVLAVDLVDVLQLGFEVHKNLSCGWTGGGGGRERKVREGQDMLS